MKLEHANMTVRSIDEAIRFLQIVFPDSYIRGGGELHGGDDSRGDAGKWVHFGNEEHYVALEQNGRHSAPEDTTYTHDGINHLGFVVEDLDGIMERLAEKGYELSPVFALTAHPHRRRAYFFDGNNIEWELVEYLSDDAAERNDYNR